MTDHGIPTGRASGLAYTSGKLAFDPAFAASHSTPLGADELAELQVRLDEVNAAAELYQITEQRLALCMDAAAEAQAALDSATESHERSERAVESFSASLRPILRSYGLVVTSTGITSQARAGAGLDVQAPAPVIDAPGGYIDTGIHADHSHDSENRCAE